MKYESRFNPGDSVLVVHRKENVPVSAEMGVVEQVSPSPSRSRGHEPVIDYRVKMATGGVQEVCECDAAADWAEIGGMPVSSKKVRIARARRR